MKKRILSFVVILAMTLSFLPTISIADIATSGALGDNLNWTFDVDTGTLTISGTGDMIDSIWSPFKDFSDNVLKAVIEEGVTSIGENAFNYCESLTTADISDSVITISDNAFLGCKSLTSVVIGNGVATIGNDAFRSCTNLNNVTMGSNVQTIKRDAFSGCTALTSIVIPDSVTTIEDYAFESCDALTSVVIPDNVISVGANIFDKCKNLANVKIGNKVPAISEGMFEGCTSLSDVTIGSSVASIEKDAFNGCSALTSISIPESVTAIKENAFLGCDALSEIVLPDNVTSVGSYAFSVCDNLKKATLSNNITVIEEHLFDNSGLKAIYIPKQAELVKKDAFDATELAYVYYSGNEEDRQNLVVLENNEMLTNAKWIYNATELPEHIYADECDTDCEICDLGREAPHAYGEYVSDNNATTEADGTKTRECSECGNKETVTDVGSRILSPAELTEIFSAASNSYFSVFLFEQPLDNEHRLAAFILSKYYQEIAEYEDAASPGIYNVPEDIFEALVSKTFVMTDDQVASLKESEIYRENNGDPYYTVGMIETFSDEPPLYYGYTDNGNNQYTLYAVWSSDVVEEDTELEGEDGVDYVKYYGAKFPITFGYALDVNYTNGTVQYKGYTVIEETSELTEIAKTPGYVRYNGTVVEPHTHSFGEYVSDNNATTEADGTKTRVCSGCGYKETVTDVGSKLPTVTPTPEPTPTPDPVPSPTPEEKPVEIIDTTKVFTDVKANKWYTNAVNYAYSHSFIAGVSATEFGRDVSVTRGMFITILARIAGVDTSKAANKVETKFTDVKSGKYYTAAIKWASENNIVSGLSDTEFGPEASIERQQLCTMIVNFAKFMKVDLTASQAEIAFADGGNIRKYAKTAVKACQMAGIVSGYASDGGTEFKPLNTATRAEAAQILYKFHKDFVVK